MSAVAPSPARAAMKAVVVTGGFHTRLRPVTLTLPLPLCARHPHRSRPPALPASRAEKNI